MARGNFEIGGDTIAAGSRATIEIPLGVLSNHVPMTLPVHVVHGRRDGPVAFVSAAIHGDEVQGVEIIRRLVQSTHLKALRGTLMLIPVVNVYGLIGHTRYLPDRRDLNRSFPGNANGSLAGQLAYVFMEEVVRRSSVGIDLHTGSYHRVNLPQIRTDCDIDDCLSLAKSFGPPVILHSNLRDGSLREAAQKDGVNVLIYEAGEALRFDELSIRAGVKGVLKVLQALDMIAPRARQIAPVMSIVSRSSYWLRANGGGIFRATKTIGDQLGDGETAGVIADPFGYVEVDVSAASDGIIIGRTNLPVVNQGDALFHIARVYDPDVAEANIGELEQELESDPLFDGPVLV